MGLRIAYVGNFEPEWSTENDVRIAFESMGHEVVKLQENTLDVERLRDAALNADLLLWTSTWHRIGLEDAMDVFHACARQGVPTATYHLDTFWVTERGGRKWWREAMFHTAHVFTADGDHQDEWARLGVNHHWLRPGVRHTAAVPGVFREEFACDVAFVGSNGRGYHEDVWSYRRELVDELRAMCARRGWSFRNPGGDEDKVGRGEMSDFYASAKVTVGDSLCPLREASHYWSDRFPEATGRHGFVIAPRIDALADIYPLMPTYDWGDFAGLERTIEQWLAVPSRRAVVEEDCYQITANGHTFTHVMGDLLDTVGLGVNSSSLRIADAQRALNAAMVAAS